MQSVVTILKILLIDLWLCLRSFGFFNGKPRHCCCVSGRKCFLGKFLSGLFWHYNRCWKEEKSLSFRAQFMELHYEEAWKIQDFSSLLYRICPLVANVMLQITDQHNFSSSKFAFITARIMLYFFLQIICSLLWRLNSTWVQFFENQQRILFHYCVILPYLVKRTCKIWDGNTL